jgi:hypothetical protein
MIGTLIPMGALRLSRSNSGKCIKSKVLESPTDFKLLDVLKRRTLLPVSVASGTGMVCSPWRRMGPAERFEAYGLSVVRRDEEAVEPVIDSWRTVRRGPRRRGPARELMMRTLGFEAAIVKLCVKLRRDVV